MAKTATKKRRACLASLWSGALTALLWMAGSNPAQAQEMRFSEAVELLQSDDADSIQLALETLGARGEARAVRPIADRIRGGLPAELTDMAVMTLGAIGRPEAGPVLIELLHHRRSEVRQLAAEAIAASKPRGGGDALVGALDDVSPSVRASAALGLGQLKHRAAIDALFRALDRNVLEAGQAIGQMATPEQVDRLFAQVGRIPFDALSPAFTEILARDDFPARAKIDLVGRLGELATAEVKTYLTEIADSLPEGEVRAAAIAAAERIVS